MTSPEPTPSTTTSSRAAELTSPARPQNAADAALFDAIATAQASIYGYGIVSAHSVPDLNYLVSSSMAAHRRQREEALAMLQARSVDARCPRQGTSCRSRWTTHRRGQSRGANGRRLRGRVAGRRGTGHRREGARVRGGRADGLRGQGGTMDPRSGHDADHGRLPRRL